MGYMSPQTLKSNSFEGSPVVSVESGETKLVELLFFFLPTPEFSSLLNDKATQPLRHRIVCHNEAGGIVESTVFSGPTHNSSGAARLKSAQR